MIHIKHKWLQLLLLAIPLSLVYCNEGDKNGTESNDEVKVDTQLTALSAEKTELITDLLESLSPPIELSYILNDLELQFNGKVLADINKVNSLASSKDRAMALGIYSTDLIYCYMHNRTDLAEAYQKAIEQLLIEMKLEQIVDIKKFQTLKEDLVNPEELAMDFTFEMERVNNYLKQSKQLTSSALISYAGWVESMYIASIVGKEIGTYPEEVVDLIYYESIVSTTYLEIFNSLNEIGDFKEFVDHSAKIKSIYDEIEVELSEVDAKVVHHDSITNVVNVSTQTIGIDEAHLAAIVSEFHKMRLEILNK